MEHNKMSFEFEINNINFIVKIEKDTNYIPLETTFTYDKETRNLLIKNTLSFYSIFITSFKSNQLKVTHYFPGIPLATDKDELQDDLEAELEENIISKVIDYWTLIEKN